MIALAPLGEASFLAHFPDESTAARWASAVRARGLEGVEEVVTAYRAVAVFGNPRQADPESLARSLADIDLGAEMEISTRLHEVPVLYDGEDLAEVARLLRLRAKEVVAEHTGPTYRVFAVGFLPGFPYAGYLPERLGGLARRRSPRTRVPAGSVAIVGRQTGIYPSDSPGGWHLIGRTPLEIINMDDEYFPIRAGDRLRFVPIDHAEFCRRRGDRL